MHKIEHYNICSVISCSMNLILIYQLYIDISPLHLKTDDKCVQLHNYEAKFNHARDCVVTGEIVGYL